MAINFGPRRGFSTYFGGQRNDNLIPQNRGLAQRAQEKVDQLANTVGRKTVESIRVDGHPIRLWNRQPRGGIPCSCAASDPRRVPDELSPLTPGLAPGMPENTPSNLDAVFDDASRRVTPGSGLQLKLRNSSVLNMRDEAEVPLPEPEIPTAGSPELDASPLTDQSVHVDPEFDDMITGDFADLLGLVSGDVKVCGLCYGTGFVDGYRYSAGQRIVLESRCLGTNTTMYLNGVDVDESAKPNVFRCNLPNQFVVWKTELPAFIECEGIRVMNNTADVTDAFLIEFQPLGISGWFSVPDPSWINMLAGSWVQFRVSPRNGSLDDAIQVFTHVDIVLRQRDQIYAQMPQIERMLNLDSTEALINTDFEIEPTVSTVYRESLIEYPRRGLLFRITSVVNAETAKGILYGIKGNMRVVQPMEKTNAIRLGEKRDVVQRPFRGIEAVNDGLYAGLDGAFSPPEEHTVTLPTCFQGTPVFRLDTSSTLRFKLSSSQNTAVSALPSAVQSTLSAILTPMESSSGTTLSGPLFNMLVTMAEKITPFVSA